MSTHKLRFIPARYTAMPSTGGWAVPVITYGVDTIRDAEIAIITEKLECGLTQGIDYRIELHYPSASRGPQLRQIVFTTDAAFIMGKITL